jgi:hypothetical protein
VAVKLFGEFEVVRGGVAIPIRGAKQRALLALLALNRGNPVSADRLIDQLWGEVQTEFAYAGFADAEWAHLNELALVATEYRVEADLELGHHNDLVRERMEMRPPTVAAGPGHECGDVSCTLGTVMAGSL